MERCFRTISRSITRPYKLNNLCDPDTQRYAEARRCWPTPAVTNATEQCYKRALELDPTQCGNDVRFQTHNNLPPPRRQNPPLEKNPGFWKILKPRRKNSRAKRAKKIGLFLCCFSRQNGPKTVKAWKILKPRAEHFGKFGKY